MIVPLLILLGLAVPVFLFWAYLHERLHLSAIRFTVGESWHEISVLPRRHPEGGIRWAQIRWQPDREATQSDRFIIGMAPRLAGVVALVCLPVTAIVPGYLGWVLAIFFWGGVIDTITGSLGVNERSDLKKATKTDVRWLWVFRLTGLLLCVISGGTWLALGGVDILL
jgi:hypothetical protein